jgi:hypothetical protein
VGQPRAAELLDDARINFRRRGQIEESVAPEFFSLFQVRQTLGQLRVSVLVVVVPCAIEKICRESIPLGRFGGTTLANCPCRFAR